ncbi:MAG TPA: DNA-3-methyladenine glycosylase [Candidatus Eisenbacteria bacterium]|nr:DNA-3-methyladenine glycosylase [Candidatus Eisenbacteria bacterium]
MFTDPILNQLVKKYPAPKFEDNADKLYENLIESIVSQQLSVKAADTIYSRFLTLFRKNAGVARVGDPQNLSGVNEMNEAGFGGDERQDPQINIFPTPKQILAMPDETIRSAGISFQKISYIKSVADAFLSDLIDIKKIQHMSDEEVIAALTQIRGVGKWTAEMILIFTLGRPDVFSLGDLGIRNAITKLYGITDKEKMLKLSESWIPYRSTACWYLWRSLENK